MIRILRAGAFIFLSLSIVLSACSRDRSLAQNKPNEQTRTSDMSASLDVPPPGSIAEELRTSVHANVSCTGCHVTNSAPTASADEASQLGKASCDRCHSQQVATFKASIHAKFAEKSHSET